MWLRNIIWFILLLGIIILSILLFVLIINPTVSPGTGSDSGQAQQKQQIDTSLNTNTKEAEPPKDSVEPNIKSQQQPDSGARAENPGNPDEKKAKETPAPDGYAGRITGFITLVAAIFPLLFLLAEGLPRWPSMRQFYQAFLPFFPFFGFLFQAAVALHGGVMLYMQTKWTVASGTGFLLYAVFLFMLLRASLVFVRRRAPIQMRRGIAPFISLLLFILFHIISGSGP